MSPVKLSCNDYTVEFEDETAREGIRHLLSQAEGRTDGIVDASYPLAASRVGFIPYAMAGARKCTSSELYFDIYRKFLCK